MFEVEREGDVTVLTATMEFNSFSRLSARRQIDELLSDGSPRVVLDLSRMETIDSSGLGSIVAAYRRAREAGGDLCLCGLNRQVREAFDITRLDEVISAYPGRSEALDHFSRASD